MNWDISLKIKNWDTIFSTRSFWICYYRLSALKEHWEEFEEDLSDWQKALQNEIGNASNAMRTLYTSPYDFDNEDIEEIFQANTIFLEFPHHYTLEIAFWEGEHCTLFHPDFPDGVELGRDDGHPLLPIFRQDELAVLKEAVIRNDCLPFERKYLGLLINKWASITMDVDGEAALSEKYHVWLETNLFTEEEIELFVRKTTGSPRGLWEYDWDLGWVNNGRHCLRSLQNPQTAKIVSDFFHTILQG